MCPNIGAQFIECKEFFMKKIILIIAITMSCLILASCAKNESSLNLKESNSENTYIELAEEYIENGEYDLAISVLQKGIDSTGDEKLSEKLKEVLAIQAEDDKQGIVVDSEENKEIDIDDVGKSEIVKGFPWVDISGKYVDDEGVREDINFAYDEKLDTYYAAWGIDVLEDVTAEGNTLSGMIGNAEITFTYDEDSENLQLRYYDFTTKNSFSLNYGRIIEITHEEAKSNIDFLIQEKKNDSNYYYNEHNNTYEEGKISIKPKYVYWNGSSLVAECFVINGYSYTVTDINVATFTLSASDEIIASGGFGLLNNLTLESHTNYVMTFTFNSGIHNYNADLARISGWESSVTCKNANSSSANNGYIKYGDVLYDNISEMLPVSLEQIMFDINNKDVRDICGRYKASTLTLESFLPLKCDYDKNVCTIYFRGYFKYDDVIADNKFYLTYDYNDVGGWVFKSRGSKEIREYPVNNSPVYYDVDGRKNGNFSYDEYPAGSPLSIGEIADDILCSRLNYLSVDEDWHIFDIDSLSIVKGDFWENEYDKHLDLIVKATLSNDLYDAIIEYELGYVFYELGGWELELDYIKDDYTAMNRTKDRKFIPKTVTYNDKSFIENANKYFDKITTVNVQDSTDSQGRFKRVTTYDCKRNSIYLKEYYDMVNIATYNGTSWDVDVSVTLREVDYSKLIGVWEATMDGETIKINIIDMKWTGGTSGHIRYRYESTPWTGAGGYSEEEMVEYDESTKELNVNVGYFYYQNYDSTSVIYHENPMVNIVLDVGTNDYVSLNICKDELYTEFYKIGNSLCREAISFKKIS